jgi:predicted HTH transcriptional regulator
MLDTLKSIAGFLNTKGGSLFIGVEEDKAMAVKVCGINEDLRLNGGSRDKLQRKLRDLITERIGAKFSPRLGIDLSSFFGGVFTNFVPLKIIDSVRYYNTPSD